jgi:hypothetical protein
MEKVIKSEKELTTNLIDFLDINGYKVRTEVPNMGQSTDIVAVKGRWITSVEAKINNWQKALEQCKCHELIADYIYIAICSVKVSSDLFDIAKLKGYGIIHCDPYDSTCTFILRARNNTQVWPPQREIFKIKMREIEYEN